MAIVIGILIVSATITLYLVEEPIRRYAERTANEILADYDITIATLRLLPFLLAIDLENVVVRLYDYPNPPLATLPQCESDTADFAFPVRDH